MDGNLLAWYARYLEINEQLDEAAAFYERAGDYSSLVRLFCDQGLVERARGVVPKLKQGAAVAGAAFHPAMHLEEQGEVEAAIGYFIVERASYHALRLANLHGLACILAVTGKYFRGGKEAMLLRKAGALDRRRCTESRTILMVMIILSADGVLVVQRALRRYNLYPLM